MKHNVKKRRLGRSTAQRKTLVRNLLTSLILNGEIKTTASRAKVISGKFDELVAGIRHQKEDREKIRYAKRVIFGNIAQRLLFEQILPAVENRRSGLTRLTALGPRKGDAAEIVHIEILAENT